MIQKKTKEKTKLDFIKIKKNLCVPKVIKTTCGVGHIFANHVSDKGLVFRIYKHSNNSTMNDKQPNKNVD